MKRLLVSLLIVLGVVGAAFATGSAEAGIEEVYTLRVVAPGDRFPGHDELFTMMNEMSAPEIGLAYDAEFVPWADFGTVRNLYLQSGEAYDGVLIWEPELQDLWRQRAFASLTEYVSEEQTPHLVDIIPIAVFEDMSIGGEYTVIPSVSEYFNFYDSYVIRADLRKAYGMDRAPQTRAEFEEYFQAIVDNEEGIFPVRGMPPIGATKLIDGEYTFFVGPDNLAVLDPETNELSMWAEHPRFRALVEMMHDWYERGYVDPDSLVDQDAGQRWMSGEIAAYPHQRRMAGSVSRSPNLPDGFEPEAAIPLEDSVPPLRDFWANNLIAVPRGSEQPDALPRYLDWVFAEKWDRYMPFIYGVPGKDWVREGEAIRVGTEGSSDRMDGGEGPVLFPQWWFWQAPLLPEDLNWAEEEAYYWNQVRDPDVEVIEHPALGFNVDLREISTVSQALSGLVSEFVPGLNSGIVDPDDPDRGLEAFAEALRGAGWDRYLEEVQAQWDEHVENRG